MHVSRRRASILNPVFMMLLAAGGLLLPSGAARAQERAPSSAATQPPFTVASIVGTFAWTHIGHGGQFPGAGLGVLTFDGAGRFSGTVTLNLPGEDFTNRIPDFRSSFSGSYTLNADGTGTSTTRFTLPGGSSQETSSHFVVTKAVVRSGRKIAREFKLVADRLSIEASVPGPISAA